MPVTVIRPKGYEGSGGVHRRETPRTSYFTHIDGLRGFAILLVVFFHIFVGKVSAGVDVFLLIGGLLFVSSQTRNGLNPHGLTFTQSVIRIFRRLYPSLIITVVVATIASLLVMPAAQWKDILEHASSSLLYAVNFVFIEQGDDYVRAGAGADSYQHLWSMSSQMQIYIMLLIIIVVITSMMRSTPKQARWVVSAVVSLMTVGSFAYAWHLNSVDQDANYYSTFSRFWEIGLGSLVGVFLLQKVILAPVLRWAVSLLGFCMIICAGVFLNGVEQFPGPLTLIPLAGAVMIILSGKQLDSEPQGVRQLGVVVWLLKTRVMVWFGKISYNLYLWHWVVLIIGGQITGWEYADPKLGIPVIAISLLIAWIVHTYVEVPLRQKIKPMRAGVFSVFSPGYVAKAWRKKPVAAYPVSGAVMSLLMIIVVASPFVYTAYTTMEQRKLDRHVESLGGYEQVYPGAMQNIAGVVPPQGMPILPSLDDVDGMLPATQEDQCYSDFKSTELVLNKPNGRPCEYGDVRSQDTLYMVGGSHSEMFLPALDVIAKKHRFKIIPIIKMGCGLYQNELWNGEPYPECAEWSDKAVDYILKNPPTMGIFHTSTRPSDRLGNGSEIVPSYYVDTIRRFDDAGITSYLVRDIPWMMINPETQKDIRVCVSDMVSSGGDIASCGQPAPQSLSPVDPSIAAYGGMKHVKLMDVNGGFITPDEWVQPVMGNLLVYRDPHHLTNMFSETLAPMLEDQMYNRFVLPSDQPPVQQTNVQERPLPPDSPGVIPAGEPMEQQQEPLS